MIKLLHVISDSNIGGAGIYVQSLTRALDPKKFKVFVACPHNSRLAELIEKPVRLIELPGLSAEQSFSLQGTLSLLRFIKENDIDIVHTHASLSGRLAARIAGKKIVFTRHTPVTVYPKNSLKWLIQHQVNLWLCDQVVAVSGFIAKQLDEHGFPPERINLIYNGVDMGRYAVSPDTSLLREKYGLNQEYIIVVVARLEEIKGHKYLLTALSTLDLNEFNIKLLIVGDGSQKESLQTLVKELNLEKIALFTGSVNDVRPFLDLADVLVLPSLQEALGLVLLEAMAVSRPCVATRVGGIPEVIRDGVNGILVKAKDSVGLASAIVTLYQDRELGIIMGQKGQQLAKDHFSLPLMVEQMTKLYDDMFR